MNNLTMPVTELTAEFIRNFGARYSTEGLEAVHAFSEWLAQRLKEGKAIDVAASSTALVPESICSECRGLLEDHPTAHCDGYL